jgi:seryl-tRNA synthetase
MFNTLAMKHNLKVKDAPELKTIVWKGDWGLIPFMCLPSNLFHPVKDTDKHSIFRAVLKENRGRVDAKKIVSSLNDNTLNFLKQVINMEEQLKGLESELAELNAELLLCEKEIQKRNDKQKDYLLQKGEILQDIEIVKEEINMVKLMIESGTTEDGYETILGETPEELPTELGGIKLESENKEVK